MSQNKVNLPAQPAGEASVALKTPDQGVTSPQSQALHPAQVQAQAKNQSQTQTQTPAKAQAKAKIKASDKVKASDKPGDKAEYKTGDKPKDTTQAKSKAKTKTKSKVKVDEPAKTQASALAYETPSEIHPAPTQESEQEQGKEHGQSHGQIQVAAPAPSTAPKNAPKNTAKTTLQNTPQAVSLNEVEHVTYAQTILQQKLDALISAQPGHLDYFSSGFQTHAYTHVDLKENQLTFTTNEPHIAAYELSNWGVNLAGTENHNHNLDAGPTDQGQGANLRASATQQSAPQVAQAQPTHREKQGQSNQPNQPEPPEQTEQPEKQGKHGQQLLAADLESNAMTYSAVRLNAQSSTPSADTITADSRAADAIAADPSTAKAIKAIEDETSADDINDDDAADQSDDRKATIAQAAAVLEEGLAEAEPQNPYTQEINRLALQSDLKSLPQDLKYNVIQEYFAVFIKALNTIMLNCNEREIVESGLEMIINQAAPIFEIEYKTFFYMCIHGAPKALFWMLQYPFFANFFLVKQRTLTLNLPRNLVITHKIIDEQIALEVSTTMENYAELKKRFALTSVPNISLQDNIMLSLYEEQIMQKGLIKPLPKMTQRERIRKLVKLGGAFPVDPAKVRLRQVNHQIFSLHNLRVTELRNMSVALEKLAHAPRRLSRVFRKDFKHYFMPMQLIMKKMDSWVELYPVDQQCLLVQMDEGFFIRSPQNRSLVYTQESFKDHPIVILDGLEVCYKTQEEPPEETEFIRTYGDDSEYNYKGIAAFKELAARMAEAKEHLSQHFDDQDLDNYDDYDDDEDEDDDPWVPSTTLRQGLSLQGQSFQSQAYQSQSQAYQNHPSFNAQAEPGNTYNKPGNTYDESVNAYGEHRNAYEDDDDLYQRSMTKRHLQASDFEISSLDEFEDDEDEDIAELEDNETFDFADEDAVLGENNDQPADLFSTPRQQPGNVQSPGQARGQRQGRQQAASGDIKKSGKTGKTGQNGKAGKATSGQSKQRGNPSYISGVYFGSQGAAHPSQLRLFNERNLLVDELKVGFMIVTL